MQLHPPLQHIYFQPINQPQQLIHFYDKSKEYDHEARAVYLGPGTIFSTNVFLHALMALSVHLPVYI